MKLSRPKNVTFWIAVILGALGLLGKLGVIAALAKYSFWLVFIGLVVLVFGNMFKNL